MAFHNYDNNLQRNTYICIENDMHVKRVRARGVYLRVFRTKHSTYASVYKHVDGAAMCMNALYCLHFTLNVEKSE